MVKARRLSRIEIWTDLECAGGVRLGFGRAVAAEETQELGGQNFLRVHLAPEALSEHVLERRVLRTVLVGGGHKEWRIVATTDERTPAGGHTPVVECSSPLEDLSDGVLERVEAGGLVSHDFGLYGLSAEQALQAILAQVPAHFVAGTVEITELVDLSFEWSSPLAALRQLAESARGELAVERDGASGYRIHLRAPAAETPATASLRYRKNLRTIQRHRDLVPLITRAYPRGAGEDGFHADMGAALWTVTGVSGSLVTLGDFPIAFDDQLNGLYLEVEGAAGRTLIQDTLVATQQVQVASAAGISIGTRVHVRRDASGAALTYLENPEARARYLPIGSHKGKVVARPDIPGVDNLVVNPLLEEWTAGVPLGWSAFGGATVTAEGSQLYRQHGVFSADIDAPDGGGLQTGWIPLKPTGASPYFTAQIAAWVQTGRVSLELVVKDAGGTETVLPPNGRAHTTVVGAWVDNLAVAGVDLLELGAVEARLRVRARGAAARWYLDAAQLTQSAGGAAIYGGRASNDLWHEANRALLDHAYVEESYSVNVVDQERLEPEAFAGDRLDVGVIVQVVDQPLGIESQARIVQIRRDLLAAGVTHVELSNRIPGLTGQLSGTLRRPRQRGRDAAETASEGPAITETTVTHISASLVRIEARSNHLTRSIGYYRRTISSDGHLGWDFAPIAIVEDGNSGHVEVTVPLDGIDYYELFAYGEPQMPSQSVAITLPTTSVPVSRTGGAGVEVGSGGALVKRLEFSGAALSVVDGVATVTITGGGGGGGGDVTSVFGRAGDVVAAAGDYSSFYRLLSAAVPWADLDKTGSSLAHLASRAIGDTTGTLAANRGGTGLSSFTTGNFLRASGTSTLAQRTPAQVLGDISAAHVDHTHQPLTLGAHLAFEDGANYIGNAARKIVTDATPNATPGTLVARDGSGDVAVRDLAATRDVNVANAIRAELALLKNPKRSRVAPYQDAPLQIPAIHVSADLPDNNASLDQFPVGTLWLTTAQGGTPPGGGAVGTTQYPLRPGNYLSGLAFDGSQDLTWHVDAAAILAGHHHNDAYLQLVGGTLTGRTVIAHAPVAAPDYTSAGLELRSPGTNAIAISFHRQGHTAHMLYNDGAAFYFTNLTGPGSLVPIHALSGSVQGTWMAQSFAENGVALSSKYSDRRLALERVQDLIGNWGSMSVYGAATGWSGFHFPNVGSYLLANGSGFVWANAGGSTPFSFQDNNLAITGTISEGGATLASKYSGAGHLHDDRYGRLAGDNVWTGTQEYANGVHLQARNSGGGLEGFLWPRWSDNATYMNFGTGGFRLRNATSQPIFDAEHVSGLVTIHNDALVGGALRSQWGLASAFAIEHSARSQFGLFFGSDRAANYGIYPDGSAWSFPYPNLMIRFHTGIQIGAQWQYGGTRIYDDEQMGTRLFSVGEFDQNVRIRNDLYFDFGSIVMPTGASLWVGGSGPTAMRFHRAGDGSGYIDHPGDLHFRQGGFGSQVIMRSNGATSIPDPRRRNPNGTDMVIPAVVWSPNAPDNNSSLDDYPVGTLWLRYGTA